MTPCMSAYELIELVHRSHELRCSCSCVYMRLAHCRTKTRTLPMNCRRKQRGENQEEGEENLP